MRIVILSDSPTIPTGYRNQATQLAKYLQSKGHEIFYLGNGYMGTTLENMTLEGGEKFTFKIYGHNFNNPYFAQTMSHILRLVNADRFIILLDTFMLYPWFLNVDTAPSKTFFWFPSDGGGGLPKGCENILRKINVPVAMSEFGKKQVKDYHNIDSLFIPHGTNPHEFKPLPLLEKQTLRAKYGLTGKYVIGVVARNQPRKNLDRTIKSMRLIADKIDNAVLFLHLDPNDPAQGMWHIHELVKKYNLENRVIYSGMNASSGFPQGEMNNIYNVMDCFLLTTSGEGFGIPIIEAMSCEIPIVATDYTTTQELVLNNNAGLSINLAGVEHIDLLNTHQKEYDIKVLDGTMTGSWEVERGFCSIKDCAEKVEWLYKNPIKANEMGKNGRMAVFEKYSFDLVGKQWEEIIK